MERGNNDGNQLLLGMTINNLLKVCLWVYGIVTRMYNAMMEHAVHNVHTEDETDHQEGRSSYMLQNGLPQVRNRMSRNTGGFRSTGCGSSHSEDTLNSGVNVPGFSLNIVGGRGTDSTERTASGYYGHRVSGNPKENVTERGDNTFTQSRHCVNQTGNTSNKVNIGKGMSVAAVSQEGNTVNQKGDTITTAGNTVEQEDNEVEMSGNSISQSGHTVNQRGDTVNKVEGWEGMSGASVNQKGNTVNQTGDKVNQRDNTVKQRGNVVKMKDNKITKTGHTINQIGDTTNEIESGSKQSGMTVNQSGDIINQTGNDVKQSENNINLTGNTIIESGDTLNHTGKDTGKTGSEINQTGDTVTQTDNTLNQMGNEINLTGNTIHLSGKTKEQTRTEVNQSDQTVNQVDNTMNVSGQKINDSGNEKNVKGSEQMQADDVVNMSGVGAFSIPVPNIPLGAFTSPTSSHTMKDFFPESTRWRPYRFMDSEVQPTFQRQHRVDDISKTAVKDGQYPYADVNKETGAAVEDGQQHYADVSKKTKAAVQDGQHHYADVSKETKAVVDDVLNCYVVINNATKSAMNSLEHQYVEVDDTTKSAVENVLVNTWTLGNIRPAIVKVLKINNEKLKLIYKAKRAEIHQRLSILKLHQRVNLGDVMTSQYLQASMRAQLDEDINEHYLFHGVSSYLVDAMSTKGLDPAINNNSKDEYGNAVICTECSTSSDKYTDLGDEIRTMFLVRAILGEAQEKDQTKASSKGDVAVPSPPQGSVLSDGEGQFRKFAIYDKRLCLPEYVITYKRL